MANAELKSIDEYEVFLTERMTAWSPQQRVALAAAIAEHWLPAYESFSAEENWGDPASLRRSLDAVWSHVQGRTLAERDVTRHIQQVEEITPHMDDFDAEEALIACVAVKEALRTCRDPGNTIPYALASALGVFEGLVQEWPADPASQTRVWKKSVVRKELQAQLKLIEAIDGLAHFDGATVEALRERIAGLKVKAPARPKPKKPAGITNQTLFEQYRRQLESDIKGQVKGQDEPDADSYLFAVTYVGYWFGRYSRRLQTINGSYGRLADEQGERALMARNRALDVAEKDSPQWDDEVRSTIEMCLQNNSKLNIVDAGSVETPHAYGPSMAPIVAGRETSGRVGCGRLEAYPRLGKPPTGSLGSRRSAQEERIGSQRTRVGRQTRSRTLLEVDGRSDLSLGSRGRWNRLAGSNQ